jgi:aryl-alcohol dehydrogenase-like predicted oxidoreductase
MNSEFPRPGGTAQLGDRTVSRIGYGAMQLERLHDDRSAAVTLLRRAADLGVDHIDTAEFYRDGYVNDLIREAYAGRDGIVIATKVGATANPGGTVRLRVAQKPAELRSSVEDNLRSLGTDHIPLVYLRRVDVGPGITAEGDQLVDIDDQLAELTALRDEGSIGAIGLGSVTLELLRRAVPAGIVSVQNVYSLLTRDHEELLQLCTAEGIAFTPFFPLGSGFPGQPKVTDQQPVTDAAARLAATPAQVGLAWLLAHAPNVLLIPGTSDAAHLDANLAAGDVRLDDEAIAALDAVAGEASQSVFQL